MKYEGMELTNFERDTFDIVVDAEARKRIIVDANGTPINLHEFNTNDILTIGNVTYIGAENSKGDWYIKKIDSTTDTVFRHATVKNNTTVLTYADAISNKTTLTYGIYSEAF